MIFPCRIWRQAYEVLDCACIGAQHNRRRVIGCSTLGLGIDSAQPELIPHHLHQLINVPPVLRTDGTGVGNPVKQIQLFDRDGIDLVQGVNDGNVASALGFKDINQIIDSGVAPNGDIGRRNLILVHHSFDFLDIVVSCAPESLIWGVILTSLSM